MKFLFTFFLTFLFQITFSQILVISVKDDQNNIIKDYSVFKNSKFIEKSSEYVYYLNCKKSDTIKIAKGEFRSESFINSSSSDTILHTFILLPRTQEIEEILLSYEKYSKIAGEKNENILDFIYYPEKDLLLLLKSYKGNYFIEKKTDFGSTNHLLHFKPDYLFLDALGNTHIVTKDTTYQIWFHDSLTYVSKLPSSLFNSKLKPLISKNSKFLFYENFTEHNQCYILSKTDKENQVSIISKYFDEVSANIAKEDYNEIINLYNKETTPTNNIILNGEWDGSLISLGETWPLIQKIGWYLQVRSQPIQCSSFGMMNYLVLINFHDHIIEKFDDNGLRLEKINLQEVKIKNKSLIYDYFYDILYVYGTTNLAKEIFQLNPDTGELLLVGNINQIEPSHIKIIGKDVYFLSPNENGFNKLYKTKIE